MCTTQLIKIHNTSKSKTVATPGVCDPPIEKNNADAFSPAAHQYFSTLPNWQATALLISSNMLQMNSSPSKGATLHIFHHWPKVYFWLASPCPHTSLSSPNFWNSYQLVEILAPKPDGKHTLYRKRGSGEIYQNVTLSTKLIESFWVKRGKMSALRLSGESVISGFED